MSSQVSLRDFCDALERASQNDTLPLQEYLGRLRPRLRAAAQHGECVKFSRHVEYLLIATALVSICSWVRRHRAWSRRIGRMLSAQMPSDLNRALRRTERKCRDFPPRRRLLIRAPTRWRSRSWMLVPIPKDRAQRRA